MTPTEALAQPAALRRRPQQARSRARIAGVLAAAERLLAREGAGALSTTRIAVEAGVSVGSLYQYFPDKGAIVDALARHYMDEFEALMGELERDLLSAPSPDLVGSLVDAFAERYRAEPGYRELWLGRHLTEEMRAADRANKEALAAGLRRILVGLELVPEGNALEAVCRAAVLAADALLQEAFRADPAGDPVLLEEAKRMLRAYLENLADLRPTTRRGDR